MKSSGSSDPNCVRQVYDQDARSYDVSRQATPFLRRLDASERKVLRQHIIGTDNVIEVGAGTGRLTGLLLELSDSVLAVDYSPKMLATLEGKFKYRNNLSTAVWNLYELQALPNYGTYDVLVSMRVVPHLDDFSHALRILGNAVRPGGTVIVDFWNRHSYVYAKKRSSHVYNHYATWNEVVQTVEAVGLTLLHIEAAGFIGPKNVNLDFLCTSPLKRFAYSLITICKRPLPTYASAP